MATGQRHAICPVLVQRPEPRRWLGRVRHRLPWAMPLLLHGQGMAVAPVEIPHLGLRRECYLNSYCNRRFAGQSALNLDPTAFMYVEGISIAEDGVYEHAWNNACGYVYDTTWGKQDTVDYFGVTFSDEFLRYLHFFTGRHGGVFRHWSRNREYVINYLNNR